MKRALLLCATSLIGGIALACAAHVAATTQLGLELPAHMAERCEAEGGCRLVTEVWLAKQIDKARAEAACSKYKT